MKKSLQSKLNELAKLEENWDSYNAAPIGEGAILATKMILNSIEALGFPDPQLVPTSSGGIDITWEDKFNIELHSDGILESLWAEDADGNYWSAETRNEKWIQETGNIR